MDQVEQPQTFLPLTLRQRFLYGVFIILTPIFNFAMVNLLGPEWQTDKFSDYVYVFLYPEASLWFFPLIVYSITTYILLLIDENRFAKNFLVRMGIYTGVLLALQYSLLTVMTWSVSPISLVFVVMWGLPLALSNARKFIPSHWSLSFFFFLLGITAIVLFFLSALVLGMPITSFGILILFLPAMAAPFWAFLMALQASRWLWTHHETTLSLPRGLGIFAWLSVYVFALRFNILKMFELYNALPTEPPNCYIATAAANGHPRFVGSQEVTLMNGKSMRVNRQLQRLKALEIAWMGVSASSHRMMRRVYDVIGKWLAKHIQNPILADVAYFLLIPVEWISFFVLKLVIPEIQNLSERLYRS